MSGPSDRLARAVELLATGGWQQAHKIVQQEKSALAAWLHGIVHTLEGDLDNARYWYRKAKRPSRVGTASTRRSPLPDGRYRAEPSPAARERRPQERQRSRKRTTTT